MGFTIHLDQSLEQNVPEAGSLGLEPKNGATNLEGGRRRRRRGGEGEESQATDPGVSEAVKNAPEPVKEAAKVIAKATIISAVVSYFNKHKGTLAAGATATAYTALAAGVLFAADKYYSPDVCTVQWQKAVDTMALAGVTSQKDKCDIAKNAYDAGMNVAILSASALVGVALKTANPNIDVSEGIFEGVKNAIIKRMLGSGSTAPAAAATGEPPGAAPAKGKKAKAAEAPTGGRTRRRGSKKGRKSRRSRR